MRRFKGRSANACHYCRTQKVKCSGERPCTRCQASKRDCIFPSKDRLVTVPENYIRTLQNEVNQLRQSSRADGDTPLRENAERQGPHDGNPERLIENSTTEYFVSKLKGACSVTEPAQSHENAIPETPASTSRSGLSHNHHRQHSISNYTYVPLDYESSAKVAVKLPPYSYALYLLNQFEAFIGSDYHWYHRQHFHDKMEATYNSPHKQSVDKAWLCCFSVVLALGESYTCRVAPSFTIDETAVSNTNTQISPEAGQVVAPPGIELFKQGLLLLKPSYEEPTIEQIEALNLIAFYSYSLNRRRTAYAYAGMALRLAKAMGLSTTPDPRDIEPVEVEHRKRVWWTAICMDLMTCTELSIAPTDGFDDDRVGFPDNSSLSSMDASEAFSDPQHLTAQVKLHRIKYRIIERISELRSGDADETHRLLAPCLEALRYWRLEFHASLEYAEDGGFAESTLARPEMRTIASVLMRYNQCYILLLRPLLLQQLSSLVREQAPPASRSSELVSLNAECLRAARDNSFIQIALHRCHKIAKFGFWESLHIFSSLTIPIISNFIIERSPTSFPSTETTSSYQAVRELLGEMAQAGNLASRDHEQMIRDIEGLFTTGPTGSTGPTTDDIGDLDAWNDLLDFGNTGFDTAIFDAFPSSLEHF